MRWFQVSLLLLLVTAGMSLSLATGEIRVITPESLISHESESYSTVRADFSASPSSGRAPLMVLFVDTSSGNPTEWYWDFGDGGTSRDENPIHTYLRGGEYTVRLTVRDLYGESDTVVRDQYIKASPLPLVANFTAKPGSGPAPLSVQFTDRSLGARVWLWNFGDNSKESMIPDPSHTFSEPGTYRVTLKVSNEQGDFDKHTQDIDVLSSKPVTAGFTGSPPSGPAPLTVQFTDQSSGNVIAWFWDFGDGSGDSVKNPVHTYENAGTYPVTLTVSSADQSSDTVKKTDYIRVADSPITGSIPLLPGWNYVSVPRALVAGKNMAEIFQHIDSGSHSAFQYTSAAGWIPLNKSSPVQPLESYWIYSTRTDVVPLSYNPVFGQIPSRTLVKGWNSAGFAILSPVEAGQALSSVQNSWQNCIGFDSGLQRYEGMIFKGVNDNISVYPYHGYWVYMSGEGVLSGSSP